MLGDEQVLWEHVAVKFEVHTKDGQTPDSRHRTPEIPNPRFSADLTMAVVLDTPHIVLFSELCALNIILAHQTNRHNAYLQLLGNQERPAITPFRFVE